MPVVFYAGKREKNTRKSCACRRRLLTTDQIWRPFWRLAFRYVACACFTVFICIIQPMQSRDQISQHLLMMLTIFWHKSETVKDLWPRPRWSVAWFSCPPVQFDCCVKLYVFLFCGSFWGFVWLLNAINRIFRLFPICLKDRRLVLLLPHEVGHLYL